MKKALKAAFPVTIPVLLGYVFVGIAFGLLFQKAGYNFLWALLMSATVYAGSMQFVAINFFTGGFGLVQVVLMTLLVNIRHIFYGLSFIEKYKNMGRKKPYMIFSLTDETYSLLCSQKAPQGVDGNLFFFCIALLNQCYWIAGSVLGSVAGSLITFNTKGIDFAMTALFVVIFVEQWKASRSHIPALVGIAGTVLARLVFGAANMVLPAMLVITLVLLFLRGPLQKKTEEPEKGANCADD